MHSAPTRAVERHAVTSVEIRTARARFEALLAGVREPDAPSLLDTLRPEPAPRPRSLS